MRNSLLRFCYLQLTEMSRLSVRKPDRGFESLSLRHAVWVAEKIRTSRMEIREKCPYFAIIARRTGLERMSPLVLQASFVTFFSVGRFSGPVSTTPAGECNAITNR